MSSRQKKDRNEETLPDELVSEGNKGIDFEEEEEDIKTMLKNLKKEMKRMEFSHKVELDVLREKHSEELEKMRKEKEPVKVKAKAYLKNKEEDKSDVSQSSTAVSNRDIVDLIRASNVRVPTLRALDKTNIRKFINDLENYQRLVSKSSRLNIQDLISSKLASSIKLMNRMNEEDYMHLDYEEMINSICACQSAISYTEASMNLADVSMKNDSMTADVVLEYLEDFEYAIKFNGPNFSFSGKVLAKLFCKGIKPTSLSYFAKESNLVH